MNLLPRDFIASPDALGRTWTLAEAERYTHWLATHHYENFHVVSFLLPRRLHQDFYNVYSFCRWADDLGDELGDREKSLHWLGWWREALQGMYSGEVKHPVFVALAGTVRKHDVPAEPFDDLIKAFEQDQRVNRYRDFDELFEYCRCSANPVGRLVLYLCGYRDEERQGLSDATCTALQLANFWQDVTVDLEKDRIYIPLDALARHGCRIEDVLERRATPEFHAVMEECVEVARGLFIKGMPLARRVDRRLSLDIELFNRGGMKILDKIQALGYDVLDRRPAIGKGERVRLLLSTLGRQIFSKAA